MFGATEIDERVTAELRRLHAVNQELLEALAQKDEQEPVAWKRRLVEIHDALSYELGDTDPHIEDDMTDEEVREEMPVFWAAKEVAALIAGIDAALTQPSTTFSTSTTSTAVLK